MADRRGKVFCLVCPYCDAENILRAIETNEGDPSLPSREIACKSCCSLFLPSEGTLRDPTLPPSESKAA